MLLYVHRDHKINTIRDGGAQDVHLDFRTAPQFSQFNVALRLQGPYVLLGTGREPRTVLSTFTQLLNSGHHPQCESGFGVSGRGPGEGGGGQSNNVLLACL